MDAETFWTEISQAFPELETEGRDLADPLRDGFDSLSLVRVVIWIEEIAGMQRPPEELPTLGALGDLYTYYLELRERIANGPQS